MPLGVPMKLCTPNVVEYGSTPFKPSFGDIVEAVEQFLDCSFGRDMFPDPSCDACKRTIMTANQACEKLLMVRSFRCLPALHKPASYTRPILGDCHVVSCAWQSFSARLIAPGQSARTFSTVTNSFLVLLFLLTATSAWLWLCIHSDCFFDSRDYLCSFRFRWRVLNWHICD